MGGLGRLREGMDVRDLDGVRIGTLGVLPDAQGPGARHLVLEVGLLRRRAYLLPVDALARVDEQGDAHVRLRKPQVDRLPPYPWRIPTAEELRQARAALAQTEPRPSEPLRPQAWWRAQARDEPQEPAEGSA